MDFITQILATVKNSPHPEWYYLGVALFLIFIFYLVHKLLKIAIFILVIIVVLFGYNIMQGKDGAASLKTFFTAAGKAIEDGGLQKFLSDSFSQISGKKSE